MKYKIAVGGKKFEVEIGVIKDGSTQVKVNDEAYEVNIENFGEVTGTGAIKKSIPAAVPPRTEKSKPIISQVPKAADPDSAPAVGGGAVVAPISGLILEVKVEVGDTVTVGQELTVVEAMKMENSINSEISGKVLEIRVQAGAQVSTGDVLMIIE
jgi:biotin carboxyl carrier protein